jgi:putative redox protein
MGQILEARVEQDGASSAVGIVRTHRVPIDRPVAKGGTDKGPLGGEYLLVSLGGCFMSNLLAAIRAR